MKLRIPIAGKFMEVRGAILAFANSASEPDDEPTVLLQKALLLGASLFLIPLVIPWSLAYLLLDRPLAALVPGIYALITALSLFYYSKTRSLDFIRISQQLLILTLPFLLTLILGGFAESSAVIIWSIISPIANLVIFGFRKTRRWLLACVLLLGTVTLLEPYLPAAEPLPVTVIRFFFFLNILTVASVVFFLMFFSVRENARIYQLLHKEKERTERLLLNVLPREIVPRLKEDEHRSVAEHFESASILFADVVSFTSLSAVMPPDQMIALLNEIFTHFDALVEKYGVEKIRTIGDNYMVASGVPTPRTDHAQAIANLALDMLRHLDAWHAQGDGRLNFRIGLNSGPLIGAVIGRTKFHYDVWGDAVNIASRMESHGVPGKIQIAEGAYHLLKDEFCCEYRGMVDIKGKGEMKTWFLVGRRPVPPPTIVS